MGDTHHQHAPATSSRLGILKNTIGGGEIVEVQGGHIVRSTGRKDRHSKVCTAKGPRDRRVRLSAHTAIQFYDVQDRLGYDRPSKAVDWLIKKAKSSIDELAELPPWNPETFNTTIVSNKQDQVTTTTTNDVRRESEHQFQIHQMGNEVQNLHHHHQQQHQELQENQHHQQQQQQIGENPNSNNNSSSFLPPSLDSDSIADTIKSFFPMGASTGTQSMHQFQSYAPDLLSRSNSHNQDLRLSLQSFQEPMLLHHHQQQQRRQAQAQAQAHQSEQVLFSGGNPQGFDGGSSTGWEQHHHHPVELGRFQRMVAWNSGGDTGGSGVGGGAGGGGGFIFNSPPPPPLAQPLQPLFAQNNQLFSQRGPLQSSNTPSIRAWIDQPINDHDHDHDHHHHQQQHHNHQIPQAIHQSMISGIGFASSSGGFSGYRIPARIQGDQEEHDGIPNKPSSASSDSRQ